MAKGKKMGPDDPKEKPTIIFGGGDVHQEKKEKPPEAVKQYINSIPPMSEVSKVDHGYVDNYDDREDRDGK